MSHFDELFGTPEITRRENWDGKEEPWPIMHRKPDAQIFVMKTIEEHLQQQHLRNVQAATEFGLTPQDTIDIDYEEVD